MDDIHLNEVISRLYRVRKTAVEMLIDRGLELENNEIVSQDRKSFCSNYESELRDLNRSVLNFTAMDPDNISKTKVYFVKSAKLNTEEARSIIDDMVLSQIKVGILILQQNATPHAKKEFVKEEKNFHIESFKEQELIINITKHFMVPEHRLLNEEEKKGILTKYSVKENQLPRMKVADPVARYYGLKPGMIVRIKREEKGCKYVTYRYVVI